MDSRAHVTLFIERRFLRRQLSRVHFLPCASESGLPPGTDPPRNNFRPSLNVSFAPTARFDPSLA